MMDLMASPLFEYERKGDSAVILRCFSRDGSVRVPEQIGGLPVRELAPYAFSAHMDEKELTDALRRGEASFASPELVPELVPERLQELSSRENCDLSSLPVLCGERLETLILPQTMRRVGRYCFYNCGQLRRLEFPGELYDWGSGAFSGCHRMEELCVYVDPDGPSSLKQVLDELPESLNVELCAAEAINTAPGLHVNEPENAAHDVFVNEPDIPQKKRAYAHLTFPEFYEEGVENTPARILETHVHGTGILYRNCFQGKKFDFAQYDTLFPYAQAQEDTSVLIRLVLGRLRAPCHLDQRARMVYETYIRENLLLFGRYFLDAKEERGLRWFLEQIVALLPDGEKTALLEQLSDYAARRKDAQAIGRLMEFGREIRPQSRRRKRLEL